MPQQSPLITLQSYHTRFGARGRKFRCRVVDFFQLFAASPAQRDPQNHPTIPALRKSPHHLEYLPLVVCFTIPNSSTRAGIVVTTPEVVAGEPV